MNIAVYAISKNESRHVKAFMDSIDACGFPVYVLDHSTDDTADLLRARGAIVDHTPIVPFRWDLGKNAAMNLVPDKYDVCINMDLDETIVPNAREIIESAGHFSILRHLYRPEETDRLRFNHRVHRRYAATWVSPVHEYLASIWDGPIKEVEKCLIEHHPPKDKSHSVADKIIAALKDDPDNMRLQILCARDLYFEKRYSEAMTYLSQIFGGINKKSHRGDEDLVDIETFRYAKSLSAKCYEKTGDRESMLSELQSAAEWRYGKRPRREAWVELAHEYMRLGEWDDCRCSAQEALIVSTGRYEANCDPGAWSFKPHELLMHANYNLGRIEEAVRDGERALEQAKGADAERIRSNLEIVKEATNEFNKRRVLD